jgi:hypothetical protein
MTDKTFDGEQNEFVNEVTRVARVLSNKANEKNQKVAVSFYLQEPGDPTVPDYICTLSYYSPAPDEALRAEIQMLRAEVKILREQMTERHREPHAKKAKK